MAGNAAALRSTSSRRPSNDDGPINAPAGAPDAAFPRTIRKAFKAITSPTQETTLLRIPWGPRLSVLFDPRSAVSIASGKLTVYALAESSQFPIALQTITFANQTIQLLAEAGCDSYIVTAVLGSPLPAGTTQIESFIYAATYAGTF